MGFPLFRFQSFSDRSATSFLRREVYAATPDRFNDPYDGRFLYNGESIVEFLNNEGLYNLFLKKGLMHDDIDSAIQDFCRENQQDCSRSVLISCFSETVTNEMMWSNYADGGKGFVLKYDSDQIEKALAKQQKEPGFGLHRVKYTSERTDSTTFLCQRIQHYLQDVEENRNIVWTERYSELFLEKSPCWEGEREWRIVLPNQERKSISKCILTIKPAGVILGENMERMSRFVICQIAKQLNIPIFEMTSSYEKASFGYVASEVPERKLFTYLNSFGANQIDLYKDHLWSAKLSPLIKKR